MSSSFSFVCYVCLEEFQKQCLLTQHLLSSHSARFDPSTANCKINENRRWLCRFCHLPLKHYIIRKDHERRLHTKVLQYFCRQGCGAGFIDCTQRRNHEDEAHGELEYVCTICGKSFKQYHGFICHQKAHRNAKFVCTEKGCEKRCYTKKSLEKHFYSAHQPVVPVIPQKVSIEFRHENFNVDSHFFVSRRSLIKPDPV